MTVRLNMFITAADGLWPATFPLPARDVAEQTFGRYMTAFYLAGALTDYYARGAFFTTDSPDACGYILQTWLSGV